MKICMISPFSITPGRTIGGVEAVAVALAPALAALPQVSEVNVLCFQMENEFFRHQLSDKVAVWYFKGQRRLNLPTRAFLDLLQAWKFIRQYPHDVVHGQGIGFMGEIATTISPFSVVSAHGVIHVEAQKALGSSISDKTKIFLTAQMVRRVLRRSQVVISTSEYDKRALTKFVMGRQISIPNPVQPLFFTRTWQESNEPYLLYAGLMHPRKNIEGILRAFSKVLLQRPNTRLYIAGPQPNKIYAEKVLRLISTLNIEYATKLMGLLDNGTLADALRMSAGLIMFSWEETSPTIIAQAMASGKPVIASNVGGISEMVKDGITGYMIPPGDEDALSLRMIELVCSAELRKKMGICANEIAWQRYDAGKVAIRTYQAYQMVRDCG